MREAGEARARPFKKRGLAWRPRPLPGHTLLLQQTRPRPPQHPTRPRRSARPFPGRPCSGPQLASCPAHPCGRGSHEWDWEPRLTPLPTLRPSARDVTFVCPAPQGERLTHLGFAPQKLTGNTADWATNDSIRSPDAGFRASSLGAGAQGPREESPLGMWSWLLPPGPGA